MPLHHGGNSFLLAIVDEDERTFTIEGPMTDDRPWINAVCRAQEAGRHVRCFTTASGREEAITELEHTYGWRLVTAIVSRMV
jgi:hypothetical protein